MTAQLLDPTGTTDPHAELERMLIAEYLGSHCPWKDGLRGLPEETVRQLMTEASCYASAKLAEIEQRARWLGEIHGTVQPGQLG